MVSVNKAGGGEAGANGIPPMSTWLRDRLLPSLTRQHVPQPAASMTLNQDFHISVEVQLLGGAVRVSVLPRTSARQVPTW